MNQKWTSKKEKVVVSFIGNGKLVFTKMDKLQRWVARKDVKWAKHIDIFSSTSVYLESNCQSNIGAE
jgi:hypothetical protein